MVLNDLRELILGNRAKIVVFVVILVLVVSIILITEKGQKPQTNPEEGGQEEQFPEGSQPLPTNIDLSKVTNLTKEIPQDLITYKISSSQTPLSEEEVLTLAKTLGFKSTWTSKGNIELGTRYIFVQKGKNLIIQTNPPTITFSTDSSLPKGTIPTEEQTIAKGKAFLAQIGVTTLVPLPRSYRLLTVNGDLFFATQNPASAKLVCITFAPEKDGFSIIGDTPATFSATLFFDTTKTIISLQYYKTNFQFEPRSAAELKSLDTALSDLKSGKGMVVGAEPFNELSPDSNPNVLSSFSPTSVYLAYYLNKSSVLTPVYVFEGIGILKSGSEKVIATVHLPATK